MHNTKTLLITLLACGLNTVAVNAQNPLFNTQFSADPTARVFDGKIYVYPSHDISPKVDPTLRQDWFCMADYHCFSSENLTDWTDHGRILDQINVPWGNPKAYSMWAPECIKGKDGRYYFYFPDAPKSGNGFRVGVAISNSPSGPFIPEKEEIKGINGIDPTVLQASDGNNYIFWAEGGSLFMAKMKDNLLELDSEAQKVENLPAGFTEGPFAFERNGKFYLTYPWVRHDGGTECLAYAMSDYPMGPYKFTGIIMQESPTRCWTNHHSLVEYKNQWYLFYHHNDYSPQFDKNRSICCDSLYFNADGTIQEVKPTLRGVGVTDATSKIQIDRYSTKGGEANVVYNNQFDYFQGWKLILPPGSWVTYGNVKMPSTPYKVWVNTSVKPLKQITDTGLKLTVIPQPNGLSTLKLENPGKQSEQVDWITLISSDKYPFQNPNLSNTERAEDLTSRLTLEEKASLMLDESPAIPRFGIKKWQWWSEALHGYANMGHVTNFPEPIAMAASFNNEMVEKVFDAVSTEARAKWNELQQSGQDVTRFHGLSVWTPNVNIFRDPRWGRGQETYGEDPFHTGLMGSAVVRGLQGPEEAKYRKLWACAKHYAVHSGPEWSRHTADINNISARDLYETYLPAFKTLVEDAKVREIMCAYQSFDNEPCCSNDRLLQDILRNEWGFKYMVVSDCGAVADIHLHHKVSNDATHAAARATLAGTDVECGGPYAYQSIPDAVKRGLITEKEVDKHVIRLLEGRFDLGEMDDPSLVEWSQIPSSVLESKEHLQLALDMARQTVTLLQNKNQILPLNKSEKIAVLGPNADDKVTLWGNYNGTPTTTTTILDGIYLYNKKAFYQKGCDLTDTKIVTDLFGELSYNGKKGMKGTYWNNTKMEGEPIAVAYYSSPFMKNTAGNYHWEPGVNLTDFSAKYETVLKPSKSGEVVIKVESVSNFDVLVNGVVKQHFSTWRNTPTRTVIQVEAGKEYNIEIKFSHIHTYGASIKVNIGVESTIDYQDIIKQLKGIQTVVFVGGISTGLEGEEMPVSIDGFKGGDRTHIELPAVQRNFLKALKAAGKKVIFVNCSGSAIAFEPETESCDAIIQAWYPGMKGGEAVADIIFGKVNPSAKLPVTFYKSSAQLGDFEDYNMEGRTYRYMRTDQPLFPFGFGLSYTTFQIGKAQLSKNELNTIHINDYVDVTVPVTNTGIRQGTEVLQLYIRNLQDPEGPLYQLRGYERVDLKAGETKDVTIRLGLKSFEWFDTNSNTMITKEGNYEILYGNSSKSTDLQCVSLKLL